MLKDSAKIRRIFFWVLIAAIAFTLAFIFSNSLRGPEESMEQSNEVGGFISIIFPPDTAFGGFVKENTRKIAHFAEYGMLGAEIAVFVIFYLHKKLKMALMSLPFAVCVAVLDETLQYFSGRGPAIVDVWIDFAGFASFAVFTYAMAALAFYIRSLHGQKMGRSAGNG